MDVKSLYAVIPHNEGLLALKHFFDRRTTTEPSTSTLLRLAELVLTLNCFSFDDQYFKQTNVVAMGTRMGPSYANLFVGHILKNSSSLSTLVLNLTFSVDTSTIVLLSHLAFDLNLTRSSFLWTPFIRLFNSLGRLVIPL